VQKSLPLFGVISSSVSCYVMSGGQLCYALLLFEDSVGWVRVLKVFLSWIYWIKGLLLLQKIFSVV